MKTTRPIPFTLLTGLCALIALFPAPSPRPAGLEPEERENLTRCIEGQQTGILQELTGFLRLPYVNADRENISANAEHLAMIWDKV